MSRFAKGRPKVLRAGQIGLILELECICDENAAYAFTDDTAGILLFYGKVCALEQKTGAPSAEIDKGKFVRTRFSFMRFPPAELFT